MNEDPILVEEFEGGGCWQVTLNAPRGNVIDLRMIEALTELVARAEQSQSLKALVFRGAGPNFSYGASVQEHLPGAIESMLPAFHELFRRLFDAALFTMAAVEGQCLGGGLELATFCNKIFATTDAQFGHPEIRLGVFAPVGSVLLPARIGRACAEELCLTGRILSAEEAHQVGLVDAIAESPAEAAHAYFRKYLREFSAISLRHAQRAVRFTLSQQYRHAIETLERDYLQGLMATHDAVEGVRAFLEKRPPRWEHR